MNQVSRAYGRWVSLRGSFGLLSIIVVLAIEACGAADKPPLTPDGPEAEASDAGRPSTMPAPDPYNK